MPHRARDEDLLGRDVEEQGEVIDDVLSEELGLGHGGHRERDDDERSRGDVDRSWASDDDVQQPGVTFVVVHPGSGAANVRDVVSGRRRGREYNATRRIPRAVLREHVSAVDVDVEAPRLSVPDGQDDGLRVD